MAPFCEQTDAELSEKGAGSLISGAFGCDMLCLDLYRFVMLCQDQSSVYLDGIPFSLQLIARIFCGREKRLMNPSASLWS